MYLSEPEEIVAYVVCIAIIIGFAVTTYMEIKNTCLRGENKSTKSKRKMKKRLRL
jgi:hypothetical protein